LSALLITRVGLIDPKVSLQNKFVNRFLDYKQQVESVVVYGLYKEGNHELAVRFNHNVDCITNEQMLLKLLS